MNKKCIICEKKFIRTYQTIKRWGSQTTCSILCRNKLISSRNRGINNIAWKGDSIGYKGLHKWVRQNLQKPNRCINCLNQIPCDAANISQEYKRDLTDWEWLCRSCHMKKDGRMNNLKQYRQQELIALGVIQ